MVDPLPDAVSETVDGLTELHSRSRGQPVRGTVRAPKRQPLVLLAEDETATAEMYRIGLEAAGFRVRIAADVTAVFEAMETEIPDVAILDYHLSGIITGLDILDNIRLDIRAESLPVLILSNDSGDEKGEVDRARRAGAVAWLRKHETDPVRLAIRLWEALGNRDSRPFSRASLRIQSPRIVGRNEGRGSVEHGGSGAKTTDGDRVDLGRLERRSD